MDEDTKKKLIGAGKVVGGTLRVASALATVCGVGILGRYLKNHHMRASARQIGRMSMIGGKKMLTSGWKDLFG